MTLDKIRAITKRVEELEEEILFEWDDEYEHDEIQKHFSFIKDYCNGQLKQYETNAIHGDPYGTDYITLKAEK